MESLRKSRPAHAAVTQDDRKERKIPTFGDAHHHLSRLFGQIKSLLCAFALRRIFVNVFSVRKPMKALPFAVTLPRAAFSIGA